MSYCNINTNINSTSSSFIDIKLGKGYYDDFTMDQGWTTEGNASEEGFWVRDVPLPTFDYFKPSKPGSNPGSDVNNDCSVKAYVTGNDGTSTDPRNSDVDGGYVLLSSPLFDITNITNPTLSYARWFYNDGNGSNDTMTVILDNGITSVVLEKVPRFTLGSGGGWNNSWKSKSFNLSSLIAPTANMKLTVRVEDHGLDNIVEGSFDKFQITTGILGIEEQYKNNKVSAYPNPFNSSLKLVFSTSVNNPTIEVSDITGRKIFEKNVKEIISEYELQAPLSEGIYIVKIYTNDILESTVKIIKIP